MKRVTINELQPGMKLAETVYRDDGMVLLGSGVELRQVYIDKLKMMKISAVYIEEEQNEKESLVSTYATSNEGRKAAAEIIKDIILGIKVWGNVDNQDRSNIKGSLKPSETIEKLVDGLLANEKLVVDMMRMRVIDDFTFYHSVNVCVLSIIIGKALGYRGTQLNELGVGALLHDIGKTKVPVSILSKPGKLSPEEFAFIKKHPIYGYEILQTYKDISVRSMMVALQHHEKYNGTGYPRGLKGPDIYEYARIVAVADVYDALISDRTYRGKFLPQEAIEFIMASSYEHFDYNIVKVFVENVAIFPLGCMVELSTGEIGEVVENSKIFAFRPTIKILYDKNGHPSKDSKLLDLSKYHTITITRIVQEKLNAV